MPAQNGHAYAAPGQVKSGHGNSNGSTQGGLGAMGGGHNGGPGQAFSSSPVGSGPKEVPSDLVPETLGGAAIDSYRMRAYDTTLARLVYWNSKVIDLGGDFYDGPGPLSDIVLQMEMGSNPKFP